MTRPRRKPLTPEMFMDPDPLATAVLTDTIGIAGDLEGFLEQLRAYDQSSIKAILFKKPLGKPGSLGKFDWLDEVPAPIDLAEVMAMLKAKYGGGDYRITVQAGGRPRKQIEFSIHGAAVGDDPAKPAAAATGMDDFMKMMLTQQNEQRREQHEYTRRETERRDRADERRNELLLGIAGLAVPALIPVLSGANREKLGDIIALINNSKSKESSLNETLETFVKIKALTDGDKGGFDADNLVGSFAKLAGPLANAAGRAFGSGRRGEAAEEEDPAPTGDGQLHLPSPAEQAAPTLHMPHAPVGSRATGHPVIELIRPHVLYFFSAHLDPGLAAEAIADIMEREGVTEDDVSGLVAAFATSADWKSDLAGQGLDLRAEPQWADDFLAELVGAWTERDRDGGREPGRGGRMADAADDAEVRAPGIDLAGDPRTGA